MDIFDTKYKIEKALNEEGNKDSLTKALMTAILIGEAKITVENTYDGEFIINHKPPNIGCQCGE